MDTKIYYYYYNISCFVIKNKMKSLFISKKFFFSFYSFVLMANLSFLGQRPFSQNIWWWTKKKIFKLISVLFFFYYLYILILIKYFKLAKKREKKKLGRIEYHCLFFTYKIKKIQNSNLFIKYWWKSLN